MLGTAAGLLASLMAHEALKVLLDLGEQLADRLLVFEGTASRFRDVRVRSNPDCAVCGNNPSILELAPIDEPTCLGVPRVEASSVSSVRPVRQFRPAGMAYGTDGMDGLTV